MKFIALSLTLATSLCGCATQTEPPMTGATGPTPDYATINAVNAAARARGVWVVWVNLPTKTQAQAH